MSDFLEIWDDFENWDSGRHDDEFVTDFMKVTNWLDVWKTPLNPMEFFDEDYLLKIRALNVAFVNIRSMVVTVHTYKSPCRSGPICCYDVTISPSGVLYCNACYGRFGSCRCDQVSAIIACYDAKLDFIVRNTLLSLDKQPGRKLYSGQECNHHVFTDCSKHHVVNVGKPRFRRG